MSSSRIIILWYVHRFHCDRTSIDLPLSSSHYLFFYLIPCISPPFYPAYSLSLLLSLILSCRTMQRILRTTTLRGVSLETWCLMQLRRKQFSSGRRASGTYVRHYIALALIYDKSLIIVHQINFCFATLHCFTLHCFDYNHFVLHVMFFLLSYFAYLDFQHASPKTFHAVFHHYWWRILSVRRHLIITPFPLLSYSSLPLLLPFFHPAVLFLPFSSTDLLLLCYLLEL